MKNKKKYAIILIIVTIIVIGFFSKKGFFTSHAVPFDRFSKIEKGMTVDEIINIAGNPYRVRKDSPTLTSYFYGGFPNRQWCTMEVYFNVNGKVTGKFHDH